MSDHRVLSLFWLILTIWLSTTEAAELLQDASTSRKKHHLLFFMGGLKSIAALILIKIKIVLALAGVVAIVMFTIKYLMGVNGLAGLFYKEHGPPPPLALPPAPQHHYLPVEYAGHEQYYGYGSEYPSTAWDQSSHDLHHDIHHDIHHGNQWSKVGDGGRNLFDIMNFYQGLEEILQSFFHQKKKKMRKRDLISFNQKQD